MFLLYPRLLLRTREDVGGDPGLNLSIDGLASLPTHDYPTSKSGRIFRELNRS